MAKALYGHVGTVDQRLRDEVQRLRTQARALEFEVARLRADNDRLNAALSASDSVTADDLRGVADAELRHITNIEEPAFT